MGHCSTLSCLSSRASFSMPLVSFPFPIRRRMYPGLSFIWIKVKHNQNGNYQIKTCPRACFACACKYAWGWGFIFKNYMLYWCGESWLVSSQLEDHCGRRGPNTSVLQGFSVGRQIIWHYDWCPRANPFLTTFRQIQHFSAALQQSII